MKNEKMFDTITQIAIPVLTIGAQIIIAFKLPQWALFVMLVAQPFWLYSTWKAYKKAGQIGMFINTVIFSMVTIFGIVNYWVF